jgi:hypothetical protein
MLFPKSFDPVSYISHAAANGKDPRRSCRARESPIESRDLGLVYFLPGDGERHPGSGLEHQGQTVSVR